MTDEIESINTLAGLITKANKVMGKNVDTKYKDSNKNFYCGPRNSFPAFNCMYIAASKAHLKRAKFSDEAKNKILTCINKRARELNCTNKACSSKEYLPKFIELSYKEKQLYSSDYFNVTKELVEESIKSPGMELDFVDIII